MTTESDTSSNVGGDMSRNPEKDAKENERDGLDIENNSTPQPSRLSSAIQTFSPNW
jgi:hypothetical protein